MSRTAIGLLGLILLLPLAACEKEEVAFCEAWLRTGLGPGMHYERLGATLADRRLRPLEAQRAVYPNYDPETYFPRRPDHVPVILDVLANANVRIRTIRIRYRLTDAAGTSAERSETCRFLVVENTPQQVGKADLYALRTLRAASDAPEKESCCIRTDPSVR